MASTSRGYVRGLLRSKELAEARRAGRSVRRVSWLLWETDRRLTVLLVALQCVLAIVPVGQLIIFKLIVDRLVSALRLTHPLDAGPTIFVLVGIEFLLAAIGLLLREAVSYWRVRLAERLTVHVSIGILEHAQRLDLATLEQPVFYDHLRRAEESALYRPTGLLFAILNTLQGGVTLLALALVLAGLNPLTLPLLVLTSIPYTIAHSRSVVQVYALATDQTPDARQARYLSQLLSTDAGAKELRVFGLSRHLLGRYRAILERQEREIGVVAQRRAVLGLITGLLPLAAYAGIFAYFVLQALNRNITVGDLTLYTGVVLRSQDLLQQTMLSLSGILEDSLFLDDYFAFLSLRPTMSKVSHASTVLPEIQRAVVFENVSYRHPGSVRDALSDVSIELPAGKTVAVVGENGAGKTTLVKLLARLYDPERGRVMVDGRDLREIDGDAWRQQIAVVFQDYIQYYLTAGENIGFGAIERMGDEQRIAQAAESAGADRLIAGLPYGYSTVLGRWFDEGVQLSGGEWQRLALARLFMRDAALIVLDEPTAALDARGEYEVFQRVREMARGRTTLLISHRFSTVRMADHIYVLDAGRVVEQGTHDELLARGSRYAELFHLQASGYR